MSDFWQEELTQAEEDRLLEDIALKIERRRMTTPAIMALEMHKPLAHIGASASVAFAPFLVPFLGYDRVHDYSRLFKSTANVERLIVRLEQGAAVSNNS